MRAFSIVTVLSLVLLLAVNTPHAGATTSPPPELAPLIAKAQVSGPQRVIVGLRVSFQPESNLPGPQAVVIQRMAIQSAQQTLVNSMAGTNTTVVREFEYIPYVALLADGAALTRLGTLPTVTSIQEDAAVPPTLAQSTPLIGATTAWAQGFSGAGQAVAILDTGVDKTHPFLAGKVVSEACYSNAAGTGGETSLCPGGASQSTATGAGVNCTLDGCNHGTHVAGIAAGKGTSFSGVARDASIIAIQVFTRFDSTVNCGAGSAPCVLSYTSDQIAAMERVYALRNTYKIASVNLSLGGGGSTTNCDTSAAAQKSAIDNLRAARIATVIASGNNGFTNQISSPACISTAISVGSTIDSGTNVDRVSSFSNSASFLSLLAPGQVITSSIPGGGVGNLSGTSMATPHVAGAWAVMKGALPNASVDQVLAALKNTGVAITDTRNGITKPRIQLDAALAALPQLTTTDQSLTEDLLAPTTMSFPVTLSMPLSSAVTVEYATADATATGGAACTIGVDYIDRNGTLTIPAGATSGAIDVQICRAVPNESDETFMLNLANATNAVLRTPQAIGTIISAPVPEYGITLGLAQTGATKPGTSITYSHLLQNYGIQPLTDLKLSATSSLSWSIAISPTSDISLAPGESLPVTITLTVPPLGSPGADFGDIDQTTLTATSASHTEATTTVTNTTTVKLPYDVYLPVTRN